MNQGAGRVSLARADEASPASVKRSALATMLVAVAVVTGVVATASTLWQPILRDEGGFLTMSAVMADGGKLYRDVADRKLPLLFVAVEKAFRVAGPDLIIARGLMLAFLFASGGALYSLSRRVGFGRRAAWGTTAVFLWAAPMIMGAAMMTEIPVMLFGTLALVVLLGDRETASPMRSLGAGLLVGFATASKQVAALYAVAIVVWIVIDGVRRRSVLRHGISVAMFGLGVVIPIAGFIAWYAAQGLFGDMMRAIWAENVRYIGRGPFRGWMYDLLRAQVVRLAPISVAAAVYGTIAIVAYVRKGEKRDVALLALVSAFSFVPTYVRTFEHYVLAYLPALCLLGVLGWRETFRRFPVAPVAIALAVLLVGPFRHVALYAIPPLSEGRLAHQRAIADRIDALLAPDEPIYFLGEDKYYFLTGHYRHRPPVFVLPAAELMSPPEKLARLVRETPGLGYVGIVTGDLRAVQPIVRDVRARGELVFRDSVRGIESIELYRMRDPRRAPTPRPPPG